MFGIGFWEWVVILSIVVLLFGSGRISKLSEEIGRSVKAFKKGIQSESGSGDKKVNKSVKAKPVKNKKRK